MRKFIPSILELTIYAVIGLGILHGRSLWQWAAGYPPADDRLLVAATLGNREMVDEALSDGASVNARDGCGLTALIVAAQFDRVDLARRLIQHGADVNAADNIGRTSLLYAAEAGGRQMIQLLLANGADASHRDPQGRTAHEIALKHRYSDAVSLLPAPRSNYQ